MKLFSLFNHDRVSESYSEQMKQQLLWMLLLRIILYTLLLLINLLLMDERFDVITMPPSLLILYTLGVYLVTVAAAFLLLHSDGDLRRFGFVQNIVDALLASALVYLTGASQSIFSTVFFFPIIAGGLLLPLKGGLIAAAASTLLFGAVLGLEYFALLPEYLLYGYRFELHNIFSIVNHFATKGLSFFLAAFISAIFGSRLKVIAEALSTTRLDYNRLSLLYKQIFDNISTGIVTVDGDRIITSANPATVTITGTGIAQIIGRKLEDVFPDIDLNSNSSRNVCDFERKDNQKIRLGYACSRLHQGLFPVKNRTHADSQVAILTLKDIGEIERLESQMRQAEKLAAIGMMSASIAHDFRNPLAAISGSAQVLAHEFASIDDERAHCYELTKIILRESDRLTKTIADFLKFARPDSIDREWCQLRPLLEDIVQVCKADSKWPATAKIELQIDPLFRLWVDEKQLFTVLSHLINNAIAFCPRNKEYLRISASEQQLIERGTMSTVVVEDNGTGVSSEDSKKIFEPFYTTRTDGTGLGLAIVRQTIEAHNGLIAVGVSELGGARFSILLPQPEPPGA